MNGKRGKELRVRKRELERGEILAVTGQSYWEPDDDTTASLWRCGDEVMGWWWHLKMEGWRQRGRWRAFAYRLSPLGSEMPLSWQGWVERPLKAWGSTSDLTTIGPYTKLGGVCLDKWTWQPPTMRSPCGLTTPLACRLVQPRVCRQGFVYFHLFPTSALVSMNVTVGVARTNLLSNECAILDALVRWGLILLTNTNQTKPKWSPCVALRWADGQQNLHWKSHLLYGRKCCRCVLSVRINEGSCFSWREGSSSRS